MKIIETERLILREFLPSDDIDFFRMDADSRPLQNYPIQISHK